MKTHGEEVEETEEDTGDTNESFLFHNSSARFISLQNAARERKFLSRTLEVKFEIIWILLTTFNFNSYNTNIIAIK